MIKIAIIEDEIISSQKLQDMIRKYANEHTLEVDISTYFNGKSFLENLNQVFDLVFMDINLPYMNGMEVAKKMREVNNETFLIFVTDLAQYAIKGYEVDAMDFLVKPINYAHLSSRLDKIMKLVQEKSKETKLQLKTNKGVVVTSPKNIRYIEVVDHTLIYHLINENLYVQGSLNEAEKNLSSYGFSRCNHCYLVNLAYVTSISKYSLYLQNDCLIISRNKKKQFLEAFTEYLGKHN